MWIPSFTSPPSLWREADFEYCWTGRLEWVLTVFFFSPGLSKGTGFIGSTRGTTVLSSGMAPFGHLGVLCCCEVFLYRPLTVPRTLTRHTFFSPPCGTVCSTEALDSVPSQTGRRLFGGISEPQADNTWQCIYLLFLSAVFPSRVLPEPHRPGRYRGQ